MRYWLQRVLLILWLLAVVSLCAALLQYEARQREHQFQTAQERQLQLAAQLLEARFDADRRALRMLAAEIGALSGELGSAGYYSNLRRLTQEMLQRALAAQPHWQSLSVVWRPNAFGEADEVFVGDSEFGSNEQGRFALVWSREAEGDLQRRVLGEEELKHWEQRPDMQALHCAREHEKVCFEADFPAQLALPLKRDERIEGVLGVALGDWLPDLSSPVEVGTAASSVDPRSQWLAPDGTYRTLMIPDQQREAALWWRARWPLIILLFALPLWLWSWRGRPL